MNSLARETQVIEDQATVLREIADSINTARMESDIRKEPAPYVAAPLPLADTLDAAADYMDKHGKCEGRATNNRGNVCLYGALYGVSSYNSIVLARKSLRSFLEVNDIAAWSDSHDAETVTSTMRACAALLRARQL